MKLELAEKEDNSRFVNVYIIIIFIICYVCCGFQIVFLKSPNSVFDAKVAIDDVELLDCDLPLPQSECSDVRCGNGVSCPKPFTHSVHNSSHVVILGLHQQGAAV